jgi:hypothetical protein
MEYKEILGYISVFLAAAVYLAYYYTIIRGTSRPHLYTYAIGGVVSLIVFFGALTSGAGAGAWNVGVSALFVFGVVLLSLKYGTKDITRFDAVVALGALLTIIPWILTKDPTLSVVLASLIDSASIIPTMRKTWNDPYSEPWVLWGINTLKHCLAIMAVSSLAVATVIYPISMVVMNGLLAGGIIYRRWQKKQN